MFIMADYDIQALEMHGVPCMDYMNLLCKSDGMILCCETYINALEHGHILLNSVCAVFIAKNGREEDRRRDCGQSPACFCKVYTNTKHIHYAQVI